MKIKIKATKINLTPELKQYIEEKILSLMKYYNGIIEADVEVEYTTRHHKKGELYRAEVNLDVPGKLIRVEKTTKNIYKAIDKVKDHLKTILVKYKETHR
ncbi:ribosome-associated translation inhibitor RaiA [Patescibacteria group bacterium]|nr:ribosome-associated translation inhibitor RaiA [Patescibacteria group bacterium]